MHLTRYTDYSLRVLLYLGSRQDKLATIGEIAAHYGISRNHLMKVVHQLGANGYIDTLRGKGGGIKLARPPERIGVGDVVRSMEENMAIVECFAPETCACILAPGCTLKDALGEATQSFLATLDLYTLADLIGGQAGL
ncbi:MAG TPA: Rrf2 family transcriptional regulator [Sulfuricella sp.]|nr:Rrf2 family transcriptional regulator [Sulfuricella sp.]